MQFLISKRPATLEKNAYLSCRGSEPLPHPFFYVLPKLTPISTFFFRNSKI